ncbi:MAG: hypothetical protein KHY44_14295 [Clostridiales bacterium]|nr:hypothetical protein [Clostridiales bacterium]
MNQKFEPLIPYITYNKKGGFLYSLLINRFSFLLLGILYALNFYFNIISYFSSSITFFIISILLFIKDMIDNQNRKLAAIEGFKIFILIHLINQERLINFIKPISEKELSIIYELLNEINKEDSICILQQIYYEPDNRNLISSISIKINNLAAFNSNINLIKNNDSRIR